MKQNLLWAAFAVPCILLGTGFSASAETAYTTPAGQAYNCHLQNINCPGTSHLDYKQDLGCYCRGLSGPTFVPNIHPPSALETCQQTLQCPDGKVVNHVNPGSVLGVNLNVPPNGCICSDPPPTGQGGFMGPFGGGGQPSENSGSNVSSAGTAPVMSGSSLQKHIGPDMRSPEITSTPNVENCPVSEIKAARIGQMSAFHKIGACLALCNSDGTVKQPSSVKSELLPGLARACANDTTRMALRAHGAKPGSVKATKHIGPEIGTDPCASDPAWHKGIPCNDRAKRKPQHKSQAYEKARQACIDSFKDMCKEPRYVYFNFDQHTCECK